MASDMDQLRHAIDDRKRRIARLDRTMETLQAQRQQLQRELEQLRARIDGQATIGDALPAASPESAAGRGDDPCSV